MISLPDDAYKVVQANHVLYQGLSGSGAALTLTGALPGVSFKCAATLVAIEGHADVSGSVVIGSEALAFTTATRKTTTNLLSALPVCSCSSLNCQVLIEALSQGGAPLQIETTTAIKIRMKSRTKSVPSPAGGWESIRQSYALSWASDDVDVGDIIRYGSQDYPVQSIEPLRGFASSELIRKLMF